MKRLIEWVPSRFWIVECSEHGFTPIREVSLLSHTRKLHVFRSLRWRIGEDAKTQGLKIIEDNGDTLTVETADHAQHVVHLKS